MNKRKKESFADFLKVLKENGIAGSKPVETKPERKHFLIVSEGERTEPNYFNHFKTFLPRHLLETIEVKGEGTNTINIVRKAIELRDARKKNVLLPDFDEVWAIYDKDDFPSNHFDTAVKLCQQNDIEAGTLTSRLNCGMYCITNTCKMLYTGMIIPLSCQTNCDSGMPRMIQK